MNEAILEAGNAVARALYQLGNADASTPMGGLEAHGGTVLDAGETIADGLRDVAQAIKQLAEAVERRT